MAKKTLFRLQFETDFRVVGVFCQEADYRICWLINNQLGFNFKRVSDFSSFQSRLGAEAHFSVYHFSTETLQQDIFLVNNHSSEGTPLFTAPPGLDFLLLIKADQARFDYTGLLKNLRSIRPVTASYLIDDALGRNKEPFLYDFEMFLAHELKM